MTGTEPRSHSIEHLTGMAATPKAVSHLLLLQQFPPHPLSSSSRSRTGAGRRREESYIAASSNGHRRSPDDYHATLKALNSKGRTPRKSLGQVRRVRILCVVRSSFSPAGGLRCLCLRFEAGVKSFEQDKIVVYRNLSEFFKSMKFHIILLD